MTPFESKEVSNTHIHIGRGQSPDAAPSDLAQTQNVDQKL